jgi:hypothetical protein
VQEVTIAVQVCIFHHLAIICTSSNSSKMNHFENIIGVKGGTENCQTAQLMGTHIKRLNARGWVQGALVTVGGVLAVYKHFHNGTFIGGLHNIGLFH